MHELCDARLFRLCPAHPSPPLCPQLPCGHKYCKSCVEELRQKGVDKSCPLCRKPLPPGPEKLFDLGVGIYAKIKGAIDRSRPGVDETTPWPALSTEQQGEMDQAVTMLREAADQGHMMAQVDCGDLYTFGNGVAKDDRLAFVYSEKAAQQGHPKAQLNTGARYRDGRGCDQCDERAAEWFEKAALQGHADAQHALGYAYQYGQGVPQSDEKAFELYSQSVAQGHPNAQNSLAVCYDTGRGCKQSYERAVELYRQSAAQGNMYAQYNLAVSEIRLM